MLSDKDGLLVPLDVRQELSGVALERSDKFGAHEVKLQCHFEQRKRVVAKA